MKVSNLQIYTQNNKVSNAEVILHSQNNKEVKFNYLPEDKVSVSIKSAKGDYTKVKQENLPKELEKLTSPESFHAFLKSAYVKATIMSDGETKVDIAQKGLGGGKKDGIWKGDKGGQFNAKGDQNGAVQGNNIKNKDNYLGHKGKNAKGHNVMNGGIMQNVRVGDDIVINVKNLPSKFLDKVQIPDKTPRMVKISSNSKHTMDANNRVYEYGKPLPEHEAAGVRATTKWLNC